MNLDRIIDYIESEINAFHDIEANSGLTEYGRGGLSMLKIIQSRLPFREEHAKTNGDLNVEKLKYEAKFAALKKYIEMKLRENDWRAIRDACVDIEILEARK